MEQYYHILGDMFQVTEQILNPLFTLFFLALFCPPPTPEGAVCLFNC